MKHVKGLVLNPSSLRYVRPEDGKEVEVSLDEVRRLGEEDGDFRRSIVSSKETLDTIVDASITELRRLREATGENRLKVIASALNMEHCKQIVKAYAERGQRTAYIHSREDSRPTMPSWSSWRATTWASLCRCACLAKALTTRTCRG